MGGGVDGDDDDDDDDDDDAVVDIRGLTKMPKVSKAREGWSSGKVGQVR